MAPSPGDQAQTSAVSYELAGCELSFECPMQWDDLAQTEHQDIRRCCRCNKQVTFCSTKESFDELAKRGDCVAFFKRASTQVVRLLGHPARSDKLREYLDDL